MTGALKHDLVVAHYHEVGLKGRNRSFFERRLVDNIRWALRDTGYAHVRSIPGRILIELTEHADLGRITEALGRTFGLASFSPAVSSPAEMDLIVATALALARETPFESFRVRARRGYSSFPESSQRVNEVVGQAIKDATGARVDLSHG
jgi:thiamine biosynthesis protein ThiI